MRHILIFSEDAYSIVIHPHRECTSSSRMGMCVTRSAHPHRDSGYASLEMHILTGIADMPHQEWRCYSPRIHILIEIGYVAHQQCTSSPGLRIYLTGNAHPHWDDRYASLGMHILTGIADVSHLNAHPHWDCRYTSPGMHILTRIVDIPHWDCISSLGLQISLTGNGIVDIPHWECTFSPGLWIYFTRNAHPHRDCRYASLERHILTRTADMPHH